MGGQIKDRATEGADKCHPLANDALQHLLYHVVTIGVAHATQNMAVKLTHERSLLIGEKTLDSLKEKKPRSRQLTCKVNETRRGRGRGRGRDQGVMCDRHRGGTCVRGKINGNGNGNDDFQAN